MLTQKNDLNNIFIFWAKTTDEKKNLQRKNAFHPLICHLIDVATAAQAIWDNVLTDAQKRRLAKSFRLDGNLEKAGNLFAFLIGLHDLGKCSPPFTLRGKNEPGRQTAQLYELYKNTELDLPAFAQASAARHEFVTSIILPPILESEFGFHEQLAKKISDIIGGHHGNFPTTTFQTTNKNLETVCGTEIWRKAQREFVKTLANLFELTDYIVHPENKNFDNPTAMIFAGFVTAADWIGSNSDFFKCEVEDSTKIVGDENFPIDLDEYLKKSKKRANEALRKLGWLDWVSVTEEKKFEELFPNLPDKRHLQNVAVEIASEIRKAEKPGIVVVEEQMGEGKTETAMYLADVFNAVLKQRGIYFALPTQATSNQMFGRVKDFLERKHAGEKSNVQLLLQHGHASISEEFAENIKEFKQFYSVFDEAEPRTDFANVVAAEWFTYKKRGLFVPFGVGTIDQILLAVLQVKHVFVRLFGLAHKTIIIDEVHAYDAYMSTLLERLLEWLAALGSPVIILSATLPKNRRDALVKAYLKGLGQEFEDADKLKSIGEQDVYPRISYATAAAPEQTFNIRHLGFPERQSKTLCLKWKNKENFVEDLKADFNKDGGCVAIICNTVKEAQDTYAKLADDIFFQGLASDNLPKLDLLHARFRFKDRDEREKRALLRFGKANEKVSIKENGKEVVQEAERPRCAVLVATQVIEQSLDIDFDLMISELAPADLLLQRSGRLQRHDRPDRLLFKNAPTLWVLEPETDEKGNLIIKNNSPDFGLSGVVYDKHILLRSWLKLRNCSEISIPNDIESLIEDVYDKKRKCFEKDYLNVWEETKIALDQKLKTKRLKAKAVYLTDFDDEDICNSFNLALDEDDPEKHATLRAQTRDDERPSVTVILLTEKEADSINLDLEPNEKVTEFLIMREVKFSRFGLTQEILKNPAYKQASWAKSALLRHHRLLVLKENNELIVGKDKVILEEDRGVVFETQGGNK